MHWHWWHRHSSLWHFSSLSCWTTRVKKMSHSFKFLSTNTTTWRQTFQSLYTHCITCFDARVQRTRIFLTILDHRSGNLDLLHSDVLNSWRYGSIFIIAHKRTASTHGILQDDVCSSFIQMVETSPSSHNNES
jgi:hypothetical protein